MKPIPKIPTRTGNPITRAGSWLWGECDERQFIPLLIVALLLAVVSSNFLNDPPQPEPVGIVNSLEG